MRTPTLSPDRLRTFGSGANELAHPVDVLGRARYRAALDRDSVHVTRSADTSAAIPFGGTAILFNKRAWIGPQEFGFWEQIAAQAVTKTLQEADVRFLQNHDPNLLLARTNPAMRADSVATLVLTPSTAGLVVDADMAPVSYAHDLAVLLERGDISQMSFAFDPIDWAREQLPDGSLLITITELRLYDVSVVTYPAYVETDAGLRAAAFEALCRDGGLDPETMLRHYAKGDIMPPTESETREVPALPFATERMKRARLVTTDQRDLNGWTFSDLWSLLDKAIVDELSTPDFNAYWYVWIVDVSDEWFVYYDDRPGAGHSYWQVAYTVTDDGVVSLGEAAEVVPKMTYQPVAQVEPADDDAAAAGDETPEGELSARPANAARTIAQRHEIAGAGVATPGTTAAD